MGHPGGLGRRVGGRKWGEQSWQLSPSCFAAVCEGNSTCSENEVCVRPGECRCRHGYFGANCDTSEHGQGWVQGPQAGELDGRGGVRSDPRLDPSRGLGVGTQTPEPPTPSSLQSARVSSGAQTARSDVAATLMGSVKT